VTTTQAKIERARTPERKMTIPVDSSIDTATVTTSGPNASSVGDPASAKVGSVRLRGVSVSLDTDVGQTFVADCVRHTESLLSDGDIKSKWTLTDEEWQRLADNAPLLQAVRAERERRIISGDAAREGAQRYFAKAPTVLGNILTDEQVSPRHRIEAARELRQVAGNGPDTVPGAGEKFVITINLGADEKLVFEKEIAPREPAPSDDGELS
jgi:hypothetical protein